MVSRREPAAVRAQPSKARVVTEAADQLRTVIDFVRDYAIFVIDADGRVLSWNSGARAIKGWEPHEVIGRSFEMFYTPEDRALGRPRTLLDEARRSGRVEDEGWRLRKNGERFWANVVISAIREEDGEV